VGVLRHPHELDPVPRRNLAAEQPVKLAELQRLFILEASKFGVYPLDDRLAERFNAELAGRPEPVKGNRQNFYPGMGGMPRVSQSPGRGGSAGVTARMPAFVIKPYPVSGSSSYRTPGRCLSAHPPAVGFGDLTVEVPLLFAFDAIPVVALSHHFSLEVNRSAHRTRSGR
jgi:hypothetical protein